MPSNTGSDDVVAQHTTSALRTASSALAAPATGSPVASAIRDANLARASVVAVDSVAAAREEAGDVMAAVDAGSVADGSLVEIGGVTRDWAQTRDPEAITIFKSVGLAIQDVAAAELVVGRLLGA